MIQFYPPAYLLLTRETNRSFVVRHLTIVIVMRQFEKNSRIIDKYNS